MKIIQKISLFLWFIAFTASAAQESFGTINTPVANMYKETSIDSAVVSQAIYGIPVKIVSKNDDWVMIKTPDDYTGWVQSNDIMYTQPNVSGSFVKVKNLFAKIYKEADTTTHAPLLTVPFDTELPLIKVANEKWLEIQLVDGTHAWIQQGDVVIDPKLLTLREMLNLSYQFIGIPYQWGGTSTFGYDCSGFVQAMYKQMGIVLPRDGEAQASWSGFTEVAKKDLQPGDVIYFGWNNKISHAGIYLSDNKFIAITPYLNPVVQIDDLREPHWRDIYITARRLAPQSSNPEFQSNIRPIPSDLKKLMKQYTWHQGCPVEIQYLSLVNVSYWGFDNKAHTGSLIVNQTLGPEVITIFEELFKNKFPIEKMQPIEYYKGDDQASMKDNNTSAFNCRTMTDFPNQYSIHSYGGAIDINPRINPYVNDGKVSPPESAKYLDRTTEQQGKIIQDSIIYDAFTKRGWVWGGSWPDKIQDYQHFEKPLSKN